MEPQVLNRSEAADWFRDLRRCREWTQEEASYILGVSEQTIRNMENPAAGWPRGEVLLHFLEATGAIVPAESLEPERLSDQELLERAAKDLHEVRRRMRSAH